MYVFSAIFSSISGSGSSILFELSRYSIQDIYTAQKLATCSQSYVDVKLCMNKPKVMMISKYVRLRSYCHLAPCSYPLYHFCD
jgi:hypothetical protein